MCVCVCVCVRQTHGQLYSSSYSPCLHRKIRLVSRNNALFFGSFCHKKGNSYNLIHNVYLSLGGGNKILSSFESFPPNFFFLFSCELFSLLCVCSRQGESISPGSLCYKQELPSYLLLSRSLLLRCSFFCLFRLFGQYRQSMAISPGRKKKENFFFFCLSVV